MEKDHMKVNCIRSVLSVSCQVQSDEVGYIAQCPALDVFSQGETEEEAMDNLAEALQLFVESCRERGTLDTVLKECGFQVDPARPSIGQLPSSRSHSTPHIDVQIPLMIQHA